MYSRNGMREIAALLKPESKFSLLVPSPCDFDCAWKICPWTGFMGELIVVLNGVPT